MPPRVDTRAIALAPQLYTNVITHTFSDSNCFKVVSTNSGQTTTYYAQAPDCHRGDATYYEFAASSTCAGTPRLTKFLSMGQLTDEFVALDNNCKLAPKMLHSANFVR